jgi:hypothetical protein
MSETVVRDATEEDLDALAVLREPLALHRDRLVGAAAGGVRCLVLTRDGEIAGFCLLVSVW